MSYGLMNELSRRDFLVLAGLTIGNFPWHQVRAARLGLQVNDVHSQLNLTTVRSIVKPKTEKELFKFLRETKHNRLSISICGARHAAGGQEFLTDGELLDVSELNRVVHFDAEAGALTVQGGMRWDKVQEYLDTHQRNQAKTWSVNQKQTGLNTLTISGTAGANAHGQGLALKPFVGDIQSFRLISNDGQKLNCSRKENPELFSLAVGGYGLFGIMLDVTLQLVPAQKVKRNVKLIPVSQLATEFDASLAKGYRYGHWQINIDHTSQNFLTEGYFSVYEPVSNDTPPSRGADINEVDWLGLVQLAHIDRSKAFSQYAQLLLKSHGAVDWAHEWQNNFYLPDYHAAIDTATKSPKATEVLTEFFMPMSQLTDFLLRAREYFRTHNNDIIYSVVRFIDKDDVTFLAWARERYACVIFNFHTVHSADGIAKTMDAYSFLIDKVIEAKGTFYLTYQHVASKKQLLACYPQFEKFLALKEKYDPTEVFQSDWYRWQRQLCK